MSPFPGSLFTMPARWANAACVLILGLVAAGSATAQLVDIASAPLYSGRQAHPNVVVATSVEFPTVGSAYLNIGYDRTATYLGYFNATQCYKYTGNSTTGLFQTSTAADTSTHECGGNNGFSGNLMNWATMSAIDEFRYAITGGNRIDENGPAGGTVLERATLPDGSVTGVPSFYNYGSNFPARRLDSNFPSALSSVLPNSIAGSTSGVVFIASCGTQVFFSSFDPGGSSCQNPASDLGSFHVAVDVCDNKEGPVRTDLCLQYGGSNGKYKPVGQAQVNAGQMRFAVFGYLMDRNYPGYTVPGGCDNAGWNRCRYGGVLRAPMKYVGPTTFDANQNASPNAKAEIDSLGQLLTDPEGSAGSAGGTYSGFINYINKFGANGVYKRYDPAGEMFYEAIRYYQNLGPTDLATIGTITNTIKDFFPITTSWTDPILSSCSANYIVNLSDANTWDDSYLPGANGSISAGLGRPAVRAVEGGLDAYLWTDHIGKLESDPSIPSIQPNDLRPGLANIANQNTANNASYWVSGAAYWANVNDIRVDLPGKQTIKTFSVDVAEASIDIHDRQLYLMGKYGGFNNTIDRSGDPYPEPFFATDPASPQNAAIRSNSEWIDSTGLPTNYLLASNPQKLINGLRSAFARINAQTGTLSGAALTSANLTFGSAGAYVATFNPSRWSGSVLFDSLSVDVDGNLVVSTSPIWDAGALLTDRCGTVASGSTTCTDTDASANKRSIYTTIGTGLGNVRKAIPFTYQSIATASFLDFLLNPNTFAAVLNTNPSTHVLDFLGQQRVNYLRGYRADEASLLGFRVRDSAMGDIINSGPVYEGPPSASIPDTDYTAFYLANASRTPAVYVGANDGMLHALRASDGFELFSYIPGYSYPDLPALTDPGYTHEVYVDTVPAVQEVKLNGTWKTVLVGANGNGAQGIFGLDVTNPGAFSATNVLFEFSDADDADLGSVLSTPAIAKLWVSGSGASKVYRYFAVVTSYNKRRTTVNGRTDAQVSSDTKNQGTLFLIALDHTLGATWQINSDYYKFNFPASTISKPNGLGAVTLSLSKSGDLTTAFMYFGDLQGNLWKLKTNTGSPGTWAPVLGTVSAPLPIFIAQDGSGNRQPITARPELSNGPFGSTLVYFGTGEFLGTSDLTLPASVQSEYSLLDLNPSVLITRSSDLVQRTGTVVGTNVQITGAAFSYSGTSSKKGWYLDFPSSVSQGERSVTKPAIRTGLLTFTTLTLSGDLCAAGNGYVYQVDALSGLPFTTSLNGNTGGYASTVGIPGPPRVVDLTIQSGAQQATGEVINKKTQTTLVSGTAGKIAGYGNTDPTTGKAVAVSMPPTQEINWREITNFNDRTGR